MTPLALGVYVLLCLLLAIIGRHTRVGAFGIFILALLLTPIVVGLVLALIGPRPAKPAARKTPTTPTSPPS